ncbi:MAG: restriction endonuclease subunit S [Dermatophilaceae bacterium]
MNLNLDKSAWKRVAFGDVVRNVNETVRDLDAAGVDRIIAMEHMDPGELKSGRWGSTEDGTTFTRRVKPGQTLFGKRRAYQRKVAYAEFDAICSGDIYTFEADETQMLGEFLPFLVQSNQFFDHALDTSAGSLSPRTNWRDLADFEFDLPPLDEQKRIAELLWAIERHRLRLETLAADLKITASALVSDLRDMHQESKRVRDVATVRNGQNYPKGIQDRRAGDIPFFKVADLDRQGNERYLTNPGGWVTAEDVAALGADVLPPGTVVTARVGAAIHLDRRRALASPALVDENHLVVRPHGVDPEYLLAVLAETSLALLSNGGVVPSLNQQIIGAVAFPDLSPEAEVRVGATYRALGDARDGVLAEAAALRGVKAAILTAGFGGD